MGFRGKVLKSRRSPCWGLGHFFQELLCLMYANRSRRHASSSYGGFSAEGNSIGIRQEKNDDVVSDKQFTAIRDTE